MRDVPSAEPDENRTSSEESDGSATPDRAFFDHVFRGREMLIQDRLIEAKGELEQALTHQPRDATTQNLVAVVYFRLGFYTRAAETWRELVETYPRNAGLRVQLGLASFRMGHPEVALEHIHEALRLQPDLERAWGHLGLIHWKLGRVSQARDAFLRGGESLMARPMGPGEVRGSESSRLAPDREVEEHRALMRSAAEQAITQFESESIELAAESGDEARPAARQWRTVEPGAERVPDAADRPRRIPPATSPTLAARLSAWSVDVPEDGPLAVGPGGELFVHAEHEVYLRLEGLCAVRGELRTSQVSRRLRGRDLEDSLGGANPVFRWEGPVAAVVAPPPQGQFYGLRLQSTDLLYVREEYLWGFDGSIAFESGRLPLAGEPVVLTQLHGEGTVMLRLTTAPKAVQVEEGDEVRVEPASVVGWTGRLFPDGSRGTAPYTPSMPPLAFRGQGAVLVA